MQGRMQPGQLLPLSPGEAKVTPGDGGGVPTGCALAPSSAPLRIKAGQGGGGLQGGARGWGARKGYEEPLQKPALARKGMLGSGEGRGVDAVWCPGEEQGPVGHSGARSSTDRCGRGCGDGDSAAQSPQVWGGTSSPAVAPSWGTPRALLPSVLGPKSTAPSCTPCITPTPCCTGWKAKNWGLLHAEEPHPITRSAKPPVTPLSLARGRSCPVLTSVTPRDQRLAPAVPALLVAPGWPQCRWQRRPHPGCNLRAAALCPFANRGAGGFGHHILPDSPGTHGTATGASTRCPGGGTLGHSLPGGGAQQPQAPPFTQGFPDPVGSSTRTPRVGDT